VGFPRLQAREDVKRRGDELALTEAGFHPFIHPVFVLCLVADADDTELILGDLPSLAGTRQLHQDRIIVKLVNLVEDDQYDVVLLVKDTPESFILRRHGESFVWDVDSVRVGIVDTRSDGLDCLRLSCILSTVDASEGGGNTFFTGGGHESPGDVLHTE
jgi:hypothetical protein